MRFQEVFIKKQYMKDTLAFIAVVIIIGVTALIQKFIFNGKFQDVMNCLIVIILFRVIRLDIKDPDL